MGITGCKRLREEEEQDVSIGPQVVCDPRPKPTTEDSLLFMWTMKCELDGEKEKYAEFIAIMRDFKKRGLENLDGVVDDVKALLAGHPNLIRGFNEFLPWEYIRSQGQADGGSGSGSDTATGTASDIS